MITDPKHGRGELVHLSPMRDGNKVKVEHVFNEELIIKKTNKKDLGNMETRMAQ